MGSQRVHRSVVRFVRDIVRNARRAPMEYIEHTLTHEGRLFQVVLPERFTRPRYIGHGSQGVVVSAHDRTTNRKVAIKKLANIFDLREGAQFTLRRARLAYRELLLQASLTHPSLIGMIYAYTPQDRLSIFTDIYVVMELQQCTLRTVVNNCQIIPHKPLSFIVYQLLSGVHHLHRLEIFHRDLKPDNIGFRENVTIKILDFGLARILDPLETSAQPTAGVVTIPYRAPEVALKQSYNKEVDVWSIGCIMAELILHKHLFAPRGDADLYRQIANVLGRPSQNFIDRLTGEGKEIVTSVTYRPTRPFDELFPDTLFNPAEPKHPGMTSAAARDLLKRMLRIDPEERATLEELAHHEYVEHWYKEDEWNCAQSPIRYNTRFDTVELNLEEWKELLFVEVKGLEALRAS